MSSGRAELMMGMLKEAHRVFQENFNPKELPADSFTRGFALGITEAVAALAATEKLLEALQDNLEAREYVEPGRKHHQEPGDAQPEAF